MADLPSRLDLYSVGRQYVLTRARRINPAHVDTEGTNANIFVGVSSVVGDVVIKQLAYRTAALTLDGSDDEDLDRYAYDRYRIVRKGASPARGTARITRPSVLAGAGTIPIGTKVVTFAGIEYVTTTLASLGENDFETRANVRAAEAGKSSQIGAGELSRFADPSTLFDRTLLVTNDGPTAGGEEAESNDLFRGRVRDFWRTARRGILPAIEFGALTVPGVVSARAEEVLTGDGAPARLVRLYIADSTGVASDALADEVRVALEDYRAAGIQVLISTSLPLPIAVQLRLRFRANVDTLALTDLVRSAVVAFVNSLPVNGPLYRLELGSVLQRYTDDGLIANEGTIVSPVGDLIPAVGQTLRTQLELVTLAA